MSGGKIEISSVVSGIGRILAVFSVAFVQDLRLN
jgi:hypothetical protein